MEFLCFTPVSCFQFCCVFCPGKCVVWLDCAVAAHLQPEPQSCLYLHQTEAEGLTQFICELRWRVLRILQLRVTNDGLSFFRGGAWDQTTYKKIALLLFSSTWLQSVFKKKKKMRRDHSYSVEPAVGNMGWLITNRKWLVHTLQWCNHTTHSESQCL